VLGRDLPTPGQTIADQDPGPSQKVECLHAKHTLSRQYVIKHTTYKRLFKPISCDLGIVKHLTNIVAFAGWLFSTAILVLRIDQSRIKAYVRS
jgi:hypothetical protein